MKSTDVPWFKYAQIGAEAVADTKKSTAASSKATGLAPAGASGDPAVHQILAELATARSNGDDAAVEALTAKLADLGFE